MLLYTLPFIAALIGWVTNYIAIKMLFHPREPVNLGLFVLQGIFPKRQHVLAERIGKVVSDDLISVEDMRHIFENKENLEMVHVIMDERIDDFLKNRLKKTMPMLGMFLNEELQKKIKVTLIQEVEAVIPEVIENFSKKMEDNMDVQKIVQEKVASFSSEKLEGMLFTIMKKEFRFIELIGAVLGFFIGIIQVVLVSL